MALGAHIQVIFVKLFGPSFDYCIDYTLVYRKLKKKNNFFIIVRVQNFKPK